MRDAKLRGQRAASQGLGKEDNPYEKGTWFYDKWLEGFEEGEGQ
jgi:ribosome modulation factor